MNLTQFAYYYRESLITMIYESCQQKLQLFQKVAYLSESIYKKSQEQSTDGSIEEQLSQLKVLLNYSNCDISSHIDLALQQMAIAQRIQLKINPNIIQDLDESNHSISNNNEHHEEINIEDQTQPIQQTQSEFKSDNLQQFQNNKLNKKQTLTQQQQEEENIINNNNNNHIEKKNDIFNFYSFKSYISDLDKIEQEYKIKATQLFRDNDFYTSRLEHGVSGLKQMRKEDRKFIYDLSSVQNQKKVALLLRLDNRLISKIIKLYREEDIKDKQLKKNQKNTGKQLNKSNNIDNQNNLNSNNNKKIDKSSEDESDDINENIDKNEEKKINNDVVIDQIQVNYQQKNKMNNKVIDSCNNSNIDNQKQNQSIQNNENNLIKKVRFSEEITFGPLKNQDEKEQNNNNNNDIEKCLDKQTNKIMSEQKSIKNDEIKVKVEEQQFVKNEEITYPPPTSIHVAAIIDKYAKPQQTYLSRTRQSNSLGQSANNLNKMQQSTIDSSKQSTGQMKIEVETSKLQEGKIEQKVSLSKKKKIKKNKSNKISKK